MIYLRYCNFHCSVGFLFCCPDRHSESYPVTISTRHNAAKDAEKNSLIILKRWAQRCEV